MSLEYMREYYLEAFRILLEYELPLHFAAVQQDYFAMYCMRDL